MYVNGSFHDTKTLIVNGVERYQAFINGKLKYAKGLICFNINRIKDGNNELIDWYSPDSTANLYAFWRDFRDSYIDYSSFLDTSGFYRYQNSQWNKIDNLPFLYSHSAYFQGWYTEAEGGKKIESISHLKSRTDLFKHKDQTSIPTITLYAHWKIRTIKIYVCNVGEGPGDSLIDNTSHVIGSQSYFHYRGQKRNSYISFRKIPFKTDLAKLIYDEITNTGAVWLNYSREFQKNYIFDQEWDYPYFIQWRVQRGRETIGYIGPKRYDNNQMNRIWSMYPNYGVNNNGSISWADDNSGWPCAENQNQFYYNDEGDAEIFIFPEFSTLIIWEEYSMKNGISTYWIPSRMVCNGAYSLYWWEYKRSAISHNWTELVSNSEVWDNWEIFATNQKWPTISSINSNKDVETSVAYTKKGKDYIEYNIVKTFDYYAWPETGDTHKLATNTKIGPNQIIIAKIPRKSWPLRYWSKYVRPQLKKDSEGLYYY